MNMNTQRDNVREKKIKLTEKEKEKEKNRFEIRSIAAKRGLISCAWLTDVKTVF